MTRPLQADDLYALKLVEDPQISPDGRRVAYVLAGIDRPSYEYRRTVWVGDAAGGEPRQFTAGPADTTPRWSPDGRALAFIRAPARGTKPSDEAERARGVGKPQLWVVPADGGEARQLTALEQGAGEPAWSPDGAMLLFTSQVGPGDDPEAERAATEGREVPAVRTIDRMFYRYDGHGWIYERRAHLFRIPAGGGEPAQLTDGDWDDGGAAWSPDGRRIAFTSDRTAERWRWPGSDVWVLDVPSGDLRRLTDESLSCGAPAWSPDGRSLAFCAGKRRKSGGHADLYVAAADGATAPRRLTEDFTPTCAVDVLDDQRTFHGPARPYWSADGRAIYFIAGFRGAGIVYAAAPDGGEPRPVAEGERNIFAFSMDDARRTLALGVSDPVTPGELELQPLDRPSEARRLTHVNAALLAEAQVARPEEFAFVGTDGWQLQGWVLRPAGVRPDERTPAVLEIHGGPQLMYGWSFMFEFQLLAARGYTVVYANPRGSTGYGRTFSAAVENDWGGKPFEDLMAGLGAAIARGGIDPDRLGVAGGSYGGYMTTWVVGHSDHFKAAVTMRCVSNLPAFFGTSDVGWALAVDQFDTTPWDDHDKLMHHSPIKYVANIHTPLLILHSDGDLRCPIGESEQVFAALKYLGREVTMVRFEGQTHDLSRNGHPRSRVKRLDLILDWFAQHIPATAAASTAG